jgi:hypothetical protein
MARFFHTSTGKASSSPFAIERSNKDNLLAHVASAGENALPT